MYDFLAIFSPTRFYENLVISSGPFGSVVSELDCSKDNKQEDKQIFGEANKYNRKVVNRNIDESIAKLKE